MYTGSTTPWVFIKAVESDGSAKTDLTAATAGLTGKLIFEGGTEITMSAFTDAASASDWAVGKIWQPDSNHNIYKLGVDPANFNTNEGKAVWLGSYTGGTIEGVFEIVSDYNPATAPSTHSAQDAADAVTGDADFIALQTSLTTIDGKIDTIDTNVDAVLVDTSTTLPAQISSLTNGFNSRLRSAQPLAVEIPDSGDVTFKLYLQTSDDSGVPTDADSLPTITVTGSITGSQASNLGTVTNTGTGEYEVVYTLNSADNVETLDVVWDATLSTQALKQRVSIAVTDAVAVDFTSADRTVLNNLTTSIGALNDISTAEVRTEVDAAIDTLQDLSADQVRTEVDAAIAAGQIWNTTEKNNVITQSTTGATQATTAATQATTAATQATTAATQATTAATQSTAAATSAASADAEVQKIPRLSTTITAGANFNFRKLDVSQAEQVNTYVNYVAIP